MFDDGPALFDAVVSYGLEGIVAKRRAGVYRSGYRSWTKVKNPSDWRRDSEITQMQRSRERRARLRQRPEVSRVDLLRVSFLVGHLVDRPDSGPLERIPRQAVQLEPRAKPSRSSWRLACAVIVLPGYSRPLVRVGDYLLLLDQSTYDRDRVRLTGRGHVGNGQ